MNWNTGRRCGKCGRPLAETDPGRMCFGCSKRESAGDVRAFDRGYAAAGYGVCAQAVIFSLKYGGRGDIGETLGEILYDYMISMYEPDELAGMYDVVIPVPAHRDKIKRRGFNQADLIGRSFANKAGLRYDSGAVIRIRKTSPMKELGPAERAANIRGAFEIRNSRLPLTEGSRILIIDDIFTTGATVDEIASLLKKNGAERVDFLAFAAAGDMVI
jgi:ComF family protein